MSFAQARAVMQSQSAQLVASRKAVESAQLRREGMQSLGGPSGVHGHGLPLRGQCRYQSRPGTQHLGQCHRPAATRLGQQLGHAAAAAQQLPTAACKQQRLGQRVGFVADIYGGLADTVREGLDGMSEGAQADAATTQDQLHSQLVQRYFTAQLAERAAVLRRRALDGVRTHDDAAQRMLQAGVIAKIERLQASAALAEARQQSQEADDDARLARSALAPLAQFQAQTLAHHPGLNKVAAKRTQAQALHDASQALRKPQVLAFGTREVNTQGKPNWVAGMAVRWTLWDSIDRDKLAAAGQRSVEQAELTDQQVRSDIALLVEKNWLAVEQARTRYQSGQAQEDLARELLRLRTAGLKEGTSTSLELIDAQLNVAKVQTERASAANDYVQALAALLESTGQTDALEQYMAREDILMTSDAP